MDVPFIREEEDIVVRRCDEEMLDKILFFYVGPCDALAAAALFPVSGNREALYIAGVAYGNDDVLLRYQVLYLELDRKSVV